MSPVILPPLDRDRPFISLKLFRGYSLGGAYRRVLAKPEQLSWKFVKYSDPTADLIESDLDALKKKPPIADSPGAYGRPAETPPATVLVVTYFTFQTESTPRCCSRSTFLPAPTLRWPCANCSRWTPAAKSKRWATIITKTTKQTRLTSERMKAKIANRIIKRINRATENLFFFSLVFSTLFDE